VLSLDGVHTLVDVVIVNPIRIDLVSWATFSHGVAMMVVTQTKDGLYYD
jgi:uncharacterized protein (DUF2062 family)